MSTQTTILLCATHDFRHVTDMFYCPLCEQERRAKTYAEQKARSDHATHARLKMEDVNG